MMPFIGIGTGRCGTTSIAMLTGASHERYRTLWDDPSKERYDSLVCHLLGGNGEVCYSILPFIERLIGDVDGLRIVCIYRDPGDTRRSFARMVGYNPSSIHRSHGWGGQFHSWEDYIERYHDAMDGIIRSYQDAAMRVDIETISSGASTELIALCEWLGVDQQAFGVWNRGVS